ncbi:hypothetical protein [Asticcacaulis excentricus]|uniref:Uncharacterized protein n=1 Tax=Asticcacaulis excentricus TaxID=78587 RepID=A0A3G9GBU6_9CAUL|nr:hypothetical protein [Asticcacaulis excentricus]BBF82704.1 hypothetical protein EM6_3345 [Asticcacaulis excentricus]
MSAVHLAVMAAFFFAPSDSTPVENMRLSKGLAKLEPAHFARRALIKGDHLDDAILLSTVKATRKPGPANGAYIWDGHVQVRIDRQTGQARWEVWHDLTYSGARREISEVRYQIGERLVKVKPSTVTHWIDYCPAFEMPGECSQFTRVVFEVPEEDIRAMAQSYQPQSRTPWLIRLKEARGEDVTIGVAPAEVAGAWQARYALN